MAVIFPFAPLSKPQPPVVVALDSRRAPGWGTSHDDVHWSDWMRRADEALRLGEHNDALRLCDRAAHQGADARYAASLFRGEVLIELGDFRGALTCFESVADPAVADPDVDAARGEALFELGQLPQAELALHSSLKGRPNRAHTHELLGRIAEIRGTGQEERWFRQARRLDGDSEIPPKSYGRLAFEDLVNEALDGLSLSAKAWVHGAQLVFSDAPHYDDVLGGHVGPRDVVFCLGLPQAVSGASMFGPAKVTLAPVAPTLVIYRRNLEREASTPAVLIAIIREAIEHEISASFGADV